MREAAATGLPLCPVRQCPAQGDASHSSGSFGFKPGPCFVLQQQDGQIRYCSSSLAHDAVVSQTSPNCRAVPPCVWVAFSLPERQWQAPWLPGNLLSFFQLKEMLFLHAPQSSVPQKLFPPSAGLRGRAEPAPSRPGARFSRLVPPPQVTCCAPSSPSSHKIAHSGTFPRHR